MPDHFRQSGVTARTGRDRGAGRVWHEPRESGPTGLRPSFSHPPERHVVQIRIDPFAGRGLDCAPIRREAVFGARGPARLGRPDGARQSVQADSRKLRREWDGGIQSRSRGRSPFRQKSVIPPA